MANLPDHHEPAKTLLPTTVVGSYPQPEWLVDRAMLSEIGGRARACMRCGGCRRSICRKAQDDATIVLSETWSAPASDIVTDGEIRREAIPTALPPRLRASTPTTPP